MKRSASAPVFKIPKTELEAAIQRYVDFFEFAPIAYVSFDRVGRIEEINLAAVQLLGASRTRLIGEPFALHVAKNDGPLFMNHLLRCRSSDSRVETELHLKKRNGEIISAHLASSPMTSSMRDGALLYQTAILDLTERKRAEEAIRRSEERYRTLFNLGPMAVYTIDTSGVIQEFNRQAAELWGREPALGDTDQRFCGSFKMFRPDGSFMPHDQCPMAEVASGKISVVHNGEVLIQRPDGSHVTLLVNVRPLKNDREKSQEQSIAFSTSPIASAPRLRRCAWRPWFDHRTTPYRKRSEWNHHRLEPGRETHLWLQSKRDHRQIDPDPYSQRPAG